MDAGSASLQEMAHLMAEEDRHEGGGVLPALVGNIQLPTIQVLRHVAMKRASGNQTRRRRTGGVVTISAVSSSGTSWQQNARFRPHPFVGGKFSLNLVFSMSLLHCSSYYSRGKESLSLRSGEERPCQSPVSAFPKIAPRSARNCWPG